MRAVIATVLLAWAAQLPPAAPAPRDAVATPTATGIIRGRVTDRESSQPLSRVIVRLVSSSLLEEVSRNAKASIEPRATVTGADGRYEFKQVPAAAYVVTFDPSELRGTHLRQYFGEVEADNDLAGSLPAPLRLGNGEVRSDVSAALPRALAIEGRVLDELGEPMSNVEVSAHPWGAESWMAPRSADDRGVFRLFVLKPGRYRICATPRMHEGQTESVRERPIRTCYPAATVDANAEAVLLTVADVAGIDIRVQRNRTFTVTGVAIDSAGSPAERAHVTLFRLDENGSSSNGIDMQERGGHFIARHLTTGEYAVHVEIGSPYNPEDKREPEMGDVQIRVDDADVDGIVVTTTKPARVAGRIVFEEGAPENLSEPMRVRAETPPSLPGWSFGSSPGGEVRSDLTFELNRLLGPRIVHVTGRPPGWVVKSVRYRDSDVTDTPVEFRTSSDPAALEITMTRRGAVVSGRILDAAGKIVSGGFAMLISADPIRRRSGVGIVGVAGQKSDGSFTLRPVRAGEYVIAAAISESPMFLAFPGGEALERLAQVGERIVLAENEKREIDLRVVKPQ
jgi:hypothetical protein